MYEDIKTACLYVRFSSHNQTEQSIEGQTRVCQEFCQRHNIENCRNLRRQSHVCQ